MVNEGSADGNDSASSSAISPDDVPGSHGTGVPGSLLGPTPTRNAPTPQARPAREVRG